MKISRIVFIHLLNNFSGSPKVLAVVIQSLFGKYEIDLITSSGPGFLSNIKGVNYINNYYGWSDNKVFVLLKMFVSEIFVFFKILLYKKQTTIFYTNTIVSIGAVLACKFCGKKMIYHVHEDMNLHKSLFPIFKIIYRFCNTKTIFVSEYLKEVTLGSRDSRVIYNCLEDDFIKERDCYLQSKNEKNKSSILLIGSLKKYKGIDEFVVLASMLPDYYFELVVSSSENENKKYFANSRLPKNLTVYSLQTNIHCFYQRARLLLNLSHPNEWIETFGLTILEAMSYGIPAIVPNIGGPIELVDDGINGYTVNPLDIESLRTKILSLFNDDVLYEKFSNMAFEKSKKFIKQKNIEDIEKYILS